MKPTTPIDTEMVFLRDVNDRLRTLHDKMERGKYAIPDVLGLRSVVYNRIAEVTRLRDKEATCQDSAAGQER